MPNMALFFSSSIPSFPGMLLMYFLNNLQLDPDVLVIIDTTSVFYIPHRPYFITFMASFLITFLYMEITACINMHVPFSLPPFCRFAVVDFATGLRS